MHRLWSTVTLATSVWAATALASPNSDSAISANAVPPDGAHAQQQGALDETRALKQARAATKTLGENLKAVLVAAIQNDGVAAAVDVCNEQAPGIHAGVSTQLGLRVGRTALRIRNPDNAADPWETQVLERFAANMAAGEPAGSLEYVEAAVVDGESGWHYMRPIVTQKPCLACHGDGLAAEVKAVIAERYPDDQATGFGVGSLRGAFTVFVPASPSDS